MPSIKNFKKTYKLKDSVEIDGDIWYYDQERQGYYSHYSFLTAEDFLRLQNQNEEEGYNYN